MSSEGADERWLITYADMITLLMAFFIMLYAMSVVNLAKFNELAVSVRAGFGGDEPALMYDTLGVFDEDGAGMQGGPGGLSEAVGGIQQVAKALDKALPPEDRAKAKLSDNGGRITLTLQSDDVLFARGSAALTPGAAKTLVAVAKGLRGVPGRLRVEGHTCDLPIRGRFRSNWELSAQRAINVVTFLIRHADVPAQRLSAIGYADTVPAVPNVDEKSRAQNRRIDIVMEDGGGRVVSAPAEEEASQEAKPKPVDVRGEEVAPPVDITHVGDE